jgi:hypothetical protein
MLHETISNTTAVPRSMLSDDLVWWCVIFFYQRAQLHDSPLPCRVTWLDSSSSSSSSSSSPLFNDRECSHFVSAGYSRARTLQLALWDARKLDEVSVRVDSVKVLVSMCVLCVLNILFPSSSIMREILVVSLISSHTQSMS